MKALELASGPGMPACHRVFLHCQEGKELPCIPGWPCLLLEQRLPKGSTISSFVPVLPCVLNSGLFAERVSVAFQTPPDLSPLVLSSRTSPRFELPMGTTEQPPLPQQTQPPTKVLYSGSSLATLTCRDGLIIHSV